MRNKVASVAVGRCAVTDMPLAFAALCAQVYVRPGSHAATAAQSATLPCLRAYVLPCRHAARMRSQRQASTPSQQCRACPAAVAPPPPHIRLRSATPPHAPIGPGALSHTHRGLPLARNKLRFGDAMLDALCNNLDKMSKDWDGV